ncbi:dihydrodipicolinate synthase family protein [Acetobacteraceae bacterium ESL0709]|nr:dihydrodipicolinate synthase family protein [Acetobacteraceae bacterium ESL0697]MDF7678445.1 dihydrodipicolinate synthase family protein [Acetobacteraceae bacterium ESL0709]
MNIDGIFTPAIVPLNSHSEINKKAYGEVLEFLVAAKVNGIIVAGSTGEYYAHTNEERLELAAYAKDVIGNRVPLVIGVGAIRTEDSVIFAKAAKDIKADGILIGSSPYALPTSEENAHHVLTVDKAAGLPIILYDYPGRQCVMMDKEFLSIVTKKSKNVIGIKESSGLPGQLHLLGCEFPQLQLSCGWDDQALEFFAWGARSWICAGSNFIPEEHIALYKAAVLEKDFDKARGIMKALMPLMDFLELGKFVQSIKSGCKLAGLNPGGVRAPLQPLTGAEEEQLKAIIQTLKKEVAAVTGGKR